MIESARQRILNDRPERPGEYVLYWMQQSQRERFNPALETAVGCANRLGLPVLVGFGLTDGYPEANARHYAFMLDGLADIGTALARRGIGFAVLHGSPEAVAIELARKAALVVCDRGYLRHQKAWRAAVAEAAACRVIQIEGDAVVPVDLASAKQEIGARTLRPKILKVRDEFVRPLPRTPVKVKAETPALPKALDLSDAKRLLARLDIDRSVPPVDRFKGGAAEASRRLRAFVRGGLAGYAAGRSEPAREQVSFLSAYLHFGQISPVEIALEVSEAEVDRPDAAAYLEELMVRRELAINFVEREPRYDSYACLPEWARQTLRAHETDRRPYVYGSTQLTAAATHDPYWNAAMREMVFTGYMHNHMRMYWGKKILEWSSTPEKAFATALALNNRYFLCGRDPNSYAGVAWCFGLHDRPWPERPIFGKVRSMMASGLERKFDIDAYVKRVGRLTS